MESQRDPPDRGPSDEPSADRGDGVRLPNFVVIGAAKCGTTSLFHYLAQHPDIFLPREKELHYFTYDLLAARVGGPGDDAVVEYACATREEYERRFAGVTGEAACGEISPSYFEHAEVAERIRSELDDPRIVLLLRNPIERAYSQYMHLVRDGRETLSFPEALEAEPRRVRDGWSNIWRYAGGSFYADRTRRYRERFGHARMRVILFERLVREPRAVLAELCGFLGVDPTWEFETGGVYNRSGRPRSRLLASMVARPGRLVKAVARAVPEPALRRVKQTLSRLNVGEKETIGERSRARLRDLLGEDVARLERVLGRDLSIWGL